MAVEIHVPNKNYDGYYGGVRFHKGVGVFEDEAKAKELAGRYGYKVIDVEKKADTKVNVKVDVKEDVEVKPAPKKRTPRKKPTPKAGE